MSFTANFNPMSEKEDQKGQETKVWELEITNHEHKKISQHP